jgi:hypothetical protein
LTTYNLSYSSVNFSLKDSTFKSKYKVVFILNRYFIIIREVSIEGKTEVSAIAVELKILTSISLGR